MKRIKAKTAIKKLEFRTKQVEESYNYTKKLLKKRIKATDDVDEATAIVKKKFVNSAKHQSSKVLRTTAKNTYITAKRLIRSSAKAMVYSQRKLKEKQAVGKRNAYNKHTYANSNFKKSNLQYKYRNNKKLAESLSRKDVIQKEINKTNKKIFSAGKDRIKEGIARFIAKVGRAFVAVGKGTVVAAIVFIIFIVAGLVMIIPTFVTGAKKQNTTNRIITVAKGEIGTFGGDKYRLWYTGSADGVMWCATFVSWCANECGLIKEGVFPKFQSCDAGLEYWRNKGQFVYTPHYGGEEYTPKVGDVIFFTGRQGKYDKNDATHVGLVQGYEDPFVLTIEGNTSNRVLPRKYSIGNPRILGYAKPEYPVGFSGYGKADFSGNNTAERVWNFLKSMGCNDNAAAGIFGNIYGESSMDPGSIEKSNGEGYGLCQWSFGRKQGLFNRAAAAGKPWQDEQVQLELLWDDLNGNDARTTELLNQYGGINALINASSVEKATEIFCLAFERPKRAKAMVNMRIPYARRYYELYATK